MRYHSVRIPVHGFVPITEWERDIVNHPVFQRLRRIRQLAFTEHLYPGASHSRFEHSLGVMHVATMLYDTLAEKYQHLLTDRLGYDPQASRARTLVRLAALLHDVGHAPLSHSTESLMPLDAQGKPLDHEQVTAHLLRSELSDVINEHRINKLHHNVSGDELADFYMGRPRIGPELLFWRELVSGQLDADRMDYLLRDSHHCGVSYGHFDLARIVDTLMLVEDDRAESPDGLRIGIEPGGVHAAEGLIIARYMMFTQVYFHQVRKAFDNHAAACLGQLLTSMPALGSKLPHTSTPEGRKAFLRLDDWAAHEYIRGHATDRHCDAVLTHRHDRCVHKTTEVAVPSELEDHNRLLARIQSVGIEAWAGDADKEWYKVNASEIRIGRDLPTSMGAPPAIPLSQCSALVGRIKESKQRLIFVPYERVDEARRVLLEKPEAKS